jgi:hypothetical protein
MRGQLTSTLELDCKDKTLAVLHLSSIRLRRFFRCMVSKQCAATEGVS